MYIVKKQKKDPLFQAGPLFFAKITYGYSVWQ